MQDAFQDASGESGFAGIEIAVIGMAGRFPGAADISKLWRNLVDGVDSVTRFGDAEFQPASSENSHHVPMGFTLPDIESFDAAFFGMSPREAEITDPQHRLLLECAYEALENAGYAGDLMGADVGVYVGCGPNGYLINNINANPRVLETTDPIQLLIGNEKDYLATRISYKLDLRGPSVVVQSACSTSLLAVHLAARSLLTGECDLALAGGVSIKCPQGSGYRFDPGGRFSPDGRCRPFSADAGGMVRGNGAGVVVLKRLADAVADRDMIYAVLRGSAANNDGTTKVGFAAPAVEGQARVIRAAQGFGDISPETIGYVEAHGTGTTLGDPIEVAALGDAFATEKPRTAPCLIGSIKSGIGHLDAAAGVAGLINAVSALHHGYIPGTLHFTAPSPNIDFERGRFEVVGTGRAWPRTTHPRRAGVSSFGIGGTNVHVVLEEAPQPREKPAPSRSSAVIRLSALSSGALTQCAARLAGHLRNAPGTDLDDVAFTLRFGRKPLSHRMAVVARDIPEAVRLLEQGRLEEVARGVACKTPPSVAFMFPGQGTQFPGMGSSLLRTQPVFAASLSRAAEILRPLLGLDLLTALHPPAGTAPEAAAAQLGETWLTQPALFAFEHALAEQWMAWGLKPDAMIGHSIGEYVAATLAGVMSIEDALRLVSARGRLMHDLPGGSMLAVSVGQEAIARWLGGGICLAAVNRPEVSILSGPTAEIARLRMELKAAGIDSQPVPTSHAFHSAMMDACLPAFAQKVSEVRLQPPAIRFVSNLTGSWITDAEATNAEYWVAHLRGTVLFADGLRQMVDKGGWVLLESGPGRSLSGAVRSIARGRTDLVAIPVLPAENTDLSDEVHAARVRAQLWCQGVVVEPHGEFTGGARVPLPTYPFERKRHWIDAATQSSVPAAAASTSIVDVAVPEAATALPPAAGDSLSERLTQLWSDALGVSSIDPDDDFFALGGDSIICIHIAQRARALGMPMRPAMILEHPTIAGLTEVLATEMPADAADAATLPEAEGEELGAALIPDQEGCHDPFPLTDIQHAYWIGRGALIGSGNVAAHAYNEFDCAELDLDRLQAALRGLIRRHPMLRAVITSVGFQRVLPSVPDYVVRAVDLRALDPTAAESRLTEIRRAQSHQVMPVGNWPLFDVSATLLPGGRARLHVSFDLLIADAWSIRLFWRELERRYFDPAYDPPPLSVSFRDYVLAEERLQGDTGFLRARDYWLDRAPTFPDAPNLPLACDPVTITAPHFVRRQARVESANWSALKATGKRWGLTPSALLCTAYSEVLAAWSETPRFCLNLPAFNRLPVHPDISEVIGDFTSVLLLEVDMGSDAPFHARAKAVQRQLWDDIAALQFNGVKLLRSIAGHRPTVPVMPYVFTSLIFPGTSDAPAGGRIGRRIKGISQTPQVWLDCQVYEEDGALLINWDSVEALFDPAMLDAMFADFQHILALLAKDEATWTDNAWREERSRSFVGTPRRLANETTLNVPQTILHAPILRQVTERPEALAILAERRLTYAEIGRASAAVAHDLHRAGARPGDRVAVVAEKGWAQIVAVIGILRTGCAYVPLDPGLPRERLHVLVRMSAAAAIVTVPGLEASLAWPDGVARVAIEETTPTRDVAWQDPPIDPDALAYIIFTSGTTGVPKGVMITHRAAANTVYDINHRFAVTAEDRVLALSALSFDLSVYDIFGLLGVGGTVVVPEAATARDPAQWQTLIDQAGVTIWNSVPALMELLASHAELNGPALAPTLRLVMLSGDWIPLALPGRILAFARNALLVSLGGATEASIWSIFHIIDRVDSGRLSIPYGKALVNQTFHVLDRNLRPRPDGVIGELYIGGIGLALGYLDSPVETAASFVSHPATGERLYRTGDLGRFLTDGSIEFLGRTDTQVKINGFRIETGEIERAVCAHRGVRACAVIVIGDDRRARRLVAYVCALPGAAIELDKLKAHLIAQLPGYMVPAFLFELAALPLSANGKVDRARLPSPALPPDTALRVAAATATEEKLVELWRAVLCTEDFGVTDDFFEQGGDSRQATELATRMRACFAADFPLRAIFESPTIRALAQLVDAAVARVATVDPLGPKAHSAQGTIAPLTSAQLRLWFHDMLEPGNSTYNIVEPFRLTGPIETSLFLAAIEAFVGRHDSLRTTFQNTKDGPVQVVDAGARPDLRLVDLSDAADASSVARAIDAETTADFDLERGPLFRVRLLRLAADNHVLIVAVHHIVWDGWSSAIMIREIGGLYRALVAGRETVLPEPELRFADIAVWERDRLRSDAYRLQLEYWSRQLAGPLPTLALPVDRDGPIDSPAQGARKSVLITAAAANRFRETCNRHGATLFMGYLAAWQALLHWWCDQDDVIVGVPTGYREHRQTTDVVGFLVNSIAIRTRFAGCTTFTDVLAKVRDTAIAAYANQDVPFDRIVEELRPTRRMSDSAPIFRAWFVLHDVPKPPWDLPGVTATPLNAHFLLAVHDIKLSLIEKDGRIEGGIDYRTALFDPPTIALLSRCFIALIEQIAETPHSTLTELTQALDALEERNPGLAGPEASEKAAWPAVKASRIQIRSQADGS